jgi:putative Holliday junction resolvase
VDWGERRIGLAVSDPTGTIATGLDTVVARSAAEGVRLVTECAAEVEADSIVVGLPLLLSGERGTAAEAASARAQALRDSTGLPVHEYDERLTSALSTRRMHELGENTGKGHGHGKSHNKGKSKGKERVDQGAAVALLESWLMKLSYDRRRAEESAAPPDEDES